ncbi:MAG: outer membrane lipid asymmetry maintenance protein MlaD [Desulfobulbus propionicus]|nr:MAG: outer membrane lipid asymmetry maintenance protein MlaD [Desulfobulbus propionicus]
MRHTGVEITVGIFLVIGFAAFGWLALQLGEVSLFSGSKTYILDAEFQNISGVKPGSEIQISGVSVGLVKKTRLNKDGLAVVTMQLDKSIKVPIDSIVSVKSQGILGEKYLQVTLGGDEESYKAGEVVLDTESSVDIESLISKFAFGQVK